MTQNSFGGDFLRVRFDCPGVEHTAEECHGKCCINCACELCSGKCTYYDKEETCCVKAIEGICRHLGSHYGMSCQIKGWPPGDCPHFDPTCQW
jgi:hypothetical protein